MRNLIRTMAVLALLGSRATIAQTTGMARSPTGSATASAPLSLAQDTRSIGGAPVGHRQPRASDVPSGSPNDLDHIGAEDAAVDRKLVICRGC